MHEPTPPHADSVEDSFMVDDESYDEVCAAKLRNFIFLICLFVCLFVYFLVARLQLQGRSMRSLRRCIPHQQSCLGYPLPCCDPCDTCYCRFFNAICYCRRVGHNCSPRRTWPHRWCHTIMGMPWWHHEDVCIQTMCIYFSYMCNK